MKRRIIVAFTLLCIIIVFILPQVKAAGNVYFSVANNTILPLNDATMPIYIAGQLFLPYSFFSTGDLGVYAEAGSDKAIIYVSSSKILKFNVTTGEIFDQDGLQYYRYSPQLHNGLVYVPVQLICEFFGFTCSIIDSEPANIVRLRTTSNNVNDQTFSNLVKTQLQAVYDKYVGIPSSSAAPTPSENVEPTYPDVTVYLSFYELAIDKMKIILDTLASTPYKACFFVKTGEITANADLIRRAACKGHTIGIWLTESSKESAYKEYQEASALLFEVAQVKTVIVTSLGNSAKAVEEMADSKSLVFWRTTKNYDMKAKFSVSSLTSKLSTVEYKRDSLYFSCSDETTLVLSSFLSYLLQYDYYVRQVRETSVPILEA